MFEPLAAQHTAGAVLILAALGALVLAWLSLRTAPKAFAVVAAMLVLALAARAFLVPYFAVVIAAAWTARARLRDDAVVVVASTTLAVGAQLVAQATPPPADAPDDPRASVAYWRARDNLWRARGAALAWARAEKDAPGEAYSVLAQLDWELGEHDKARRVLTHLIEGAHDRAVGEQAERLLLDWGSR
jgi:hypothetical protein